MIRGARARTDDAAKTRTEGEGMHRVDDRAPSPERGARGDETVSDKDNPPRHALFFRAQSLAPLADATEMSSRSLACPPTPLARRRLSRAETRGSPAVRAASVRRSIDDDASASSDVPTAAAPVGRRASLLAAATAMTTSAMTSLAPVPPRSFAASADAFGTGTNMRALAKAFEEAMAAGADYDAADRAWTKAIELAPLNSAAWSNRGTKRLQAGRWADARADLERSVQLSPDPNNPDPLTLNNLGNAEGALGNWDAAMANYLEASKDPTREMESIALANLALAKFQVNDVDGSLRVARTILRRDPEFWDVRALATAALWASGREADAEAEWSSLCRSGRGFGAPSSAEDARGGKDGGRGGIGGDMAYAARLLEQQVAQQAAVVRGTIGADGARKDGREFGGGGGGGAGDDTPCRMYESTAIVAPRWPPRCTAALDAFLKVARVGEALDYDGVVKRYEF